MQRNRVLYLCPLLLVGVVSACALLSPASSTEPQPPAAGIGGALVHSAT